MGSVVRGKVRAVLQFGVFVELAPNVQGLLDVLDFAADSRKRYPDDYPPVGTAIEASIKWLDPAAMNIRLTQRPLCGVA